MGAWGTGIFEDDTAADTRDHFTDLAAEGLSAEEATKRLIAESTEVLDDTDDAIIFWVALAATQWKLGRLTEKVRTRALKIIDSGRDLKLWKENSQSEVNQRKKHLAKLREQLLGPDLPEKKLRRRKKVTTDFEPGDIASYKLDDDRSIQFAVLALRTDRGGTWCSMCLLGLNDEDRWKVSSIHIANTLNPHYSMMGHEPADLITIICRGAKLPEDENRYAIWNNLPIHGYACTWKEFPAAMEKVLPRLGWR